MPLLRSQAMAPVPWRSLLVSVGVLWIAPVLVGFAGLLLFALFGQTYGDYGLYVWFAANALTFSPLFSWVGWLIALPIIWLALAWGWFGWLPAAAIGALAGSAAGALADTDIALPFGIVALLALRAVLGRVLPL